MALRGAALNFGIRSNQPKIKALQNSRFRLIATLPPTWDTAQSTQSA